MNCTNYWCIRILFAYAFLILYEAHAAASLGVPQESSPAVMEAPKSQGAKYVSLDLLRPTQNRYSAREVELKVKQAKTEGKIGKHGKLPSNHHTALFGKKKAVSVIQKGDLYYVVDGHHHTKVSMEAGATTVPVKIVGIYKGKDEDFWSWLESQHKAYLMGVDGKRRIPESFKYLQDDPLRYFAAITALKDGKKSSPCLKTPLWKKGKDAPDFIEFLIADELRKNGFTFSNGDEDKCETFTKQVEEARKLLLAHPIANFTPLAPKGV